MKTSTPAFLLFCLVFLINTPAQAGLGDWIKKEAIPTLKGDRPLQIKPYVSLKHDGAELRIGEDDLKIQIGGVTIQTHQLKKRLLQAGCVYATGGNFVQCAPDVLERELLNIADDINPSNPSTIPPDATPPYSLPAMPMPAYRLPSGTTMQQCGCWGFNPIPVAFESRCSYERVVIAACPGYCQMGGVPYSYKCM